MKSQELSQFNLPDAPGVYYFLDTKGNILYVGKATSLKDRVKSYFARDILLTRGAKIQKMLADAVKVEFKETDSVLEALILEANEIKKHLPPANSRDKDDKSYNFVVVTKEDFPRILIERGKNLDKLEYQALKVFGPFPHGGELREALKIIRKIFPYRDSKCKIAHSTSSGQAPKLKPCFNAQIGLCPGPCAGWVSKEEYRKTIRHIKLFFEGKKERLIKTLEREMLALAKKKEFEKADEVKKKIFALTHIQDIALLKQAVGSRQQAVGYRIEAYDIAHISGTNVVGVMTVITDGELDKSQYRKFKLRGEKNNDVGNLKEIIARRFAHSEWRFPNIVVVDGGKAQINAARVELDKIGLEMIYVVSVVKDERHKARGIVGSRQYVEGKEREILLANSEAHRFAINYHRLLRNKGFRI